jgi:hypothetical protein
VLVWGRSPQTKHDHERQTLHDRREDPHPAAGGRSKKITDVCRRKHNVSEVTFHRWKKQFGQMDINEAKRLKELERENGGKRGQATIFDK